MQAVRFVDVKAVDTTVAVGEGWPDRRWGCATYELVEMKPAEPRGAALRGQVQDYPAAGLAHSFAYLRGNKRIESAAVLVLFSFPSVIDVYDGGEVALTAWTSIDNLDSGDPRLKWFAPSTTLRTGAPTEFTKAELPGG